MKCMCVGGVCKCSVKVTEQDVRRIVREEIQKAIRAGDIKIVNGILSMNQQRKEFVN